MRRYQRVGIRAWSAASCAGDAQATWQAVVSQRSALSDSPAGPVGRIADLPVSSLSDGSQIPDIPLALPSGPQRLLTLARRAAAPAWAAIAAEDGFPVWCVSASKGDTAAWLAGPAPDPAWLFRSQPGLIGPRLAAALGVPQFVGAAPVAACSTGLYAVLAAADLVEDGWASHGLAGAVDCGLQPLLEAGFASLGVRARSMPSAFGGAGTGFAPAEGAGFLALANAGPWRLVAGTRLGDASHETACRDPLVLRRCLEDLHAALPSPDLIVTHGTGTRTGDAYEAAGLDAGPWRDCPRMVCKPFIGHGLGASGAIELAAALCSPAQRIWKIGLGFGGHIAGLALERS